MLYYILKFAVSAALIVTISEIARGYPLAAGVLASLPIASVLAMIWLYIDTGSVERASRLSVSIFWMVFPSLSLFLVLPLLLKSKVPFYPALALSAAAMVFLYSVTIHVLRKLG
jgi:hypothetical protein